MFKNMIIVILTFVIFSLMVQKPENVDLLIKDAATAKEMVVEGAEYIHEKFDEEFEVHSEEDFMKEHGRKLKNKAGEIIEEVNPSNFVPNQSPNQVLTNERIVEETWFNEN